MTVETIDPGQDLLSTTEAVQELLRHGLRLDARTFRRWAHNGRVPSVELPNGYRKFRRADVIAIVTGHEPTDPNEPVAA